MLLIFFFDDFCFLPALLKKRSAYTAGLGCSQTVFTEPKSLIRTYGNLTTATVVLTFSPLAHSYRH